MNRAKQTAILRISQFSLYREDRLLLDNFFLEVYSQERFVIEGSIGIGKSTFLHSLMGFYPFSGQVIYYGKPCLTDKDFATIRGNKVGLLFQQCSDQLFGPTAKEDVAFGLINMGVDKEQALERAQQQLQLLGIKHLKDRTIFQLSGGEKTLVALAGVLIMEPDLLLLDEPTNNLDTANQEYLMAILNDLNKAMIIVTHDQSLSDKLHAQTIYLNAQKTPSYRM